MTNKQYLEQIGEMDMHIAYLMEKRETLKASLLSGGVSSYGGTGGSAATPDNRSFERKMEKYVLLGEEIDRRIDALISKKEEVEKVIDTVPGYKVRIILLRRYINGIHYSQIADEYGLTEAYVEKMARGAIAKLKIPPEYKA